jgi:hypothetical protein
MDESEIAWLAGLLEGEGCFHLKTRGPVKKDGTRYIGPVVDVNMTDEDVIRKLRDITGVGNVQGPYSVSRKENWKPIWRWAVQKRSDALMIMKLVRDHMCERRRSKIDEILSTFE